MATFTSDELVEKVKDITFLPDAHELTLNSGAKILSIADDEVETLLAARVKTAASDHWAKVEDLPIVQGTLRYRIPRRALGRALASVSLASLSSGGVTPLSEIPASAATGITGASWNGRNGVYYVEDDFLVFPVQPPAGYSLRVRYLRRPNRLVPIASAAAITQAIDATHIGLASAPASFVAPKDQYFDIVRGDAPFDLMYVDLRIKNIVAPGSVALTSPSTISIADFVDTSAILNDRVDYLCLRDQTVYPQLPAELHPVLVSAVALRVMESIKDGPGAEAARATARERAASASAIIEPRNQDRSRPIVNRYSALRGGGSGNRRGRWPS